MENSLESIKSTRIKLGLTQAELAQLAGVSQSLIAKIESKRVDPTFSNTQKIFETLRRMEQKNNLKAKDVMNPKIISVNAKDNIKEVIAKMREHEISQIPIIDKDVKGVVSESGILEQIQQGKDIKDLEIQEVMNETPPVISEETDINLVTNMLKYHSIILVSKYGKLTGVITKADILRKTYK
ncbi:CBS domain-containing protein [Candidatus Woesearchaeota archaeon]|nr:CBS domain-containing protein [Candidatus Woesearchaeota archaeon]